MTAPRSKSREWLLAAATVAVAVVLFLAAAEIALRFLPVASGLRTEPVTPADPVMHFTPNRPFVYSRDWDFILVNHGSTNNAGYINEQDYHRADAPPLIAVIGDSYIEAAMLPFAQTEQGLLAKALAGRMRVYSFGASGAPLSQYLVWAQHAVKAYGASFVVINVVGNDFDESHVAYKSAPGLWLYAPDASGRLVLTLQEYHPGALRDVVYHSALARYLLFNLSAGRVLIDSGFLARLTSGSAQAAVPEFAGNTSASVDSRRMDLSAQVIDAFFRDLPGMVGLPPGRVLFLVDGFRYRAAADAARGTYFDRMRRATLDRAARDGYEAIDLDPLFFPRSDQGTRFEHPRDGHWTAAGHAVAAEAVLRSKMLQGLAP